ncbi:MAG: hypothetical protein LBJ74_02690 [Heliobacteriaceae bacterium]|nr:hypothetical protein [Heliobacteriaceae bacterium]
MGDMVLKGGISTVRYIWNSNGGACDECQALDGQEFDFPEDIPDHPHPNCQCYIEMIVDEQGDDDDEPCDCWDKMDELFNELGEIISNFENLASEIETEIEDTESITSEAENAVAKMDETLSELEPEVGQHLPDCEFNIDEYYAEMYAQRDELVMLIRDIISKIYPLQTLLATIYNLVSNYIELLGTRGDMDKYYHSVANCQNAQLGILGEQISEAACNLKEGYDSYTYVHTHKVSVEEALRDSIADQEANRLGRERGRQNPTCDCRILMQDLKPIEPTEFSIENLIDFILKRIKL